jgi:hypothetical protein
VLLDDPVRGQPLGKPADRGHLAHVRILSRSCR